ncbi:unnamed protein product [Adineta steineri]|uniref:Uncharacterized protein n=1 Tax=Adineta steineri TaxID=433720 RepID=A0A819SDH0_9BILA|nr:unnamed protein product [Adineta steineri]CAF4057648.1 unnamed protein product [Adineta steineri]
MERHFITNDTSKMNRTALSNDSLIANAVQKKNNPGREPVILPVCDQMLKDDGIEIDLKTTVIPGTKTQSKESRTLFCELTNKYPDDATYETSRLGCLLEKDGEILWDHFLLSNPMIFKKSTCVIEHIPIRDNDKVIEEIPVRIMKRKMDLNQSEIAKRCPSRGEQAQQLDIQTNTSNPVVDQCHHHQMMYTYCQDPSGNAASFSNVHPQVSNLQNEPIQHQYITSFNPSMGFCNPQYSQPQTMPNYYSGMTLQNQAAVTSMPSYMPQTGTNIDEPEIFSPFDSSYPDITQNSIYQDPSSYQQSEYPPQATLSLPSMNTFQHPSNMTTMHQSQFMSTVTRNDEPFTNVDQRDNEH